MRPNAKRSAVFVWFSTIGAMIIADVVLDRKHNGTTLSESTRWLFHTHHPVGKAVVVTGWTGLTVWLLPHICRVPGQVVEAVENLVDNIDLTNLTN